MPRPLIFLGGVSASGKTYLASAVKRAVPSCLHFSAGELISRELAQSTTEDGYQRPQVANDQQANLFQELLLLALTRLDWTIPTILDGHFVVPTRAGPSQVATEVIARIDPRELWLLQATAPIIAERLKNRGTSPRWWDGTMAMLDRLLAAERKSAEEASRLLGLPLRIAESGSEDELAIAVTSLASSA